MINQSSRTAQNISLMRLVAVLAMAVIMNGCAFMGSDIIENFTHLPLDGRAEQILAEMRVDQKVAQMLMVELEGKLRPSAQDKRLISIHSMGGVMVPSFKTVPGALGYTEDIYESAATANFRIAPFVVADTSRLAMPSATRFPVPMALSATGDVRTVRDVAVRSAREMRALGLTMAFGPAGDVCVDSTSPAMSLDCFGSSPDLVADMTAATVSGYQSQGVIAAVSHFPGLGHVDKMPDDGLSIVAKTVTDFAREDLLPFNRAVREGAGALLVSHVAVPLFNSSSVPASMSDLFLKRLLRDDWRFGGLAIADSLGQRSISGRYTPDQASINAIKAGADMIVWRGAYSRYIRTLKVVSDAVVNREIPKEQIDSSVLRILRIKEAYGLLDPVTVKESLDKRATGGKDAVDVAERAARAAVTVFKNENDLLPLDPETTRRIALISLINPDPLMAKLKSLDLSVRYSHCHSAQITKWNPESFEIDRAVKLGSQAQAAIVTLVPYKGVLPTEQRRLLHRLAATGVPVIGLMMGVPIDLSEERTLTAAVATYTPPSGHNVNMSVVGPAIDCIFGKASIALDVPHELQARRGQSINLDLGLMSRSPPGKLPVQVTGQGVSRYVPIMKEKDVRWTFGDGTKGAGPVVTHTYDKVGMYETTIECRDPFGERVSAVTTIVVGE